MEFEIPDGQVVGIIGSNSTGKTTFLKAVAKLINVDIGHITYDDFDEECELRKKVAYMTEECSFFSHMTAKQNGEFFKDFLDSVDYEKYQKLLEFFELPDKKPARTLSKGQKAKLEIAIGFSKGAKYLLMDEPFLGNDIFTRRDFLRLMSESLIKDETIVLATHLINEIENFLDRVILLDKGIIVADVLIDDLREKGESLESFMKDALGYDSERYAKIFHERVE